MINRIWDPAGKYKDGFLKEYKHWILEVSFRQHTLGCFIIFAKRKIQTISELTDAELFELRDVMQEIENTLITLPEFHPDKFNYFQMGNQLHHLHFHGIPRYSSPKTFKGQEWTDKTWGHPPIWTKTEANKELVLNIKEVLRKKIF